MNRGQERTQRGPRPDQGDKPQQRDQQQAGGDAKRPERPKKESIIDLNKYIGQPVRVKFQGGREATGKLKGCDHLLNLVLEDCVEYLRDSDDSYKVTENTRKLGLVVCRGPSVTVICPQDGHEAIENPFTNIE